METYVWNDERNDENSGMEIWEFMNEMMKTYERED